MSLGLTEDDIINDVLGSSGFGAPGSAAPSPAPSSTEDDLINDVLSSSVNTDAGDPLANAAQAAPPPGAGGGASAVNAGGGEPSDADVRQQILDKYAQDGIRPNQSVMDSLGITDADLAGIAGAANDDTLIDDVISGSGDNTTTGTGIPVGGIGDTGSTVGGDPITGSDPLDNGTGDTGGRSDLDDGIIDTGDQTTVNVDQLREQLLSNLDRYVAQIQNIGLATFNSELAGQLAALDVSDPQTLLDFLTAQGRPEDFDALAPSLPGYTGNTGVAGANNLGVNPGTGNDFQQANIDRYNREFPGWDANENGQIDPNEWARYQLQRDESAYFGRGLAHEQIVYDAHKNAVASGQLGLAEKNAIEARINELWPDGGPNERAITDIKTQIGDLIEDKLGQTLPSPDKEGLLDKIEQGLQLILETLDPTNVPGVGVKVNEDGTIDVGLVNVPGGPKWTVDPETGVIKGPNGQVINGGEGGGVDGEGNEGENEDEDEDEDEDQDTGGNRDPGPRPTNWLGGLWDLIWGGGGNGSVSDEDDDKGGFLDWIFEHGEQIFGTAAAAATAAINIDGLDDAAQKALEGVLAGIASSDANFDDVRLALDPFIKAGTGVADDFVDGTETPGDFTFENTDLDTNVPANTSTEDLPDTGVDTLDLGSGNVDQNTDGLDTTGLTDAGATTLDGSDASDLTITDTTGLAGTVTTGTTADPGATTVNQFDPFDPNDPTLRFLQDESRKAIEKSAVGQVMSGGTAQAISAMAQSVALSHAADVQSINTQRDTTSLNANQQEFDQQLDVDSFDFQSALAYRQTLSAEDRQAFELQAAREGILFDMDVEIRDSQLALRMQEFEELVIDQTLTFDQQMEFRNQLNAEEAALWDVAFANRQLIGQERQAQFEQDQIQFEDRFNMNAQDFMQALNIDQSNFSQLMQVMTIGANAAAGFGTNAVAFAGINSSLLSTQGLINAGFEASKANQISQGLNSIFRTFFPAGEGE